MNINFIKLRKLSIFISIILCLISMFFIIKNKINLGIEFTGGLEIEIKIQKNINTENIKNIISNLHGIDTKYYDYNSNSIILKIKNDNTSIINEIKTKLSYELENNILKITKISYIGAKVNNETINNSIFAIIASILSMTIYLIYRFELKSSINAVIALLHDIFLLLGVIAVFEMEVNLTILSALLTVFGYSINDTIIIFDRIRENSKKYANLNKSEIINLSINNTLSRTIKTSLTILMVSIILLTFGGKTLHEFSIILTIGIIIGTYSSIYIAAMITKLK